MTREGAVAVTHHARLRAVQRGAADPGAADEELRDMFRRGHRAARADVSGAARRCGEHVLVYSEGERPTITTVLLAGESA
jgi:hypothetical protein